MNKSNLKELCDRGHLIGSHTVSHPVMSSLNKYKQNLQIKNSFETLKAYNLITDKIYCHPYGGFHSFNKDTENLLKEEGVKYSFNVEAREIVADDYEKSMQFLPRFDCNLFKYGKAS
jgi:peptidoglycan/xylan/chitin deacetylase (PgdA/CDA1 family)